MIGYESYIIQTIGYYLIGNDNGGGRNYNRIDMECGIYNKFRKLETILAHTEDYVSTNKGLKEITRKAELYDKIKNIIE